MPSDSGIRPATSETVEREGRWTFPIFLDNGRNTPTSHPVIWRDAYGNIVHAPRQVVHMTTDAMTLSNSSSIRSGRSSPFPRPFGGSITQENSEPPERSQAQRVVYTFSSRNLLTRGRRKGSLLSSLSGHLNQEEGSVANVYRGIDRPVNPRILAPFVLPAGVTWPEQAHSQHSRSVARSSSIYSVPSPRPDLESCSDFSIDGPAFFTPPPPVGFWDEPLAHTRKHVITSFARTLIMLLVAITMIFSLYAGVLHEVNRRMSNLQVAVVSFEQEDMTGLGGRVRSVVEREMQSNPKHLGFDFFQPSDFQNNASLVRQAVYDQRFWAAIIVDPATMGNQSLSVELVYNSGRDVQTYDSYIIPVLNRLGLDISSNVAFTYYDLRTFSPPSALPAITIGLIYLTITSVYSYAFFIHNHMKLVLPNVENPHPPLKFSHWVIYRWTATFIFYFALAGAYSLISLAFQVPFTNAGTFPTTEPAQNANPFGLATFPAYCALNFVGVAALGLACENASMFLSTLSAAPYSSLFIVFWLVANASVSLYPLELANPFYRYGHAMPMRQMVEASKTLILGTRSNLPVNFGILIAWVALGTIVFPFACWVMRWKGIETRTFAEMEVKKIVDEARTSRELSMR